MTWKMLALSFLLAVPLAAEEIPLDYKTIETARIYAPEGPRKNAGYLGAIFDKLSRQYGCQVLAVREGSMAAKAGVVKGDVIVVFDRIRTPSRGQLNAVIKSKRDGESATLVILRGGKRETLSVSMKQVGGASPFGLRVKAPVAATHSGVPIAKVGPRSPAQKAGLLVGDVVTAVDGTTITNQESLNQLTSTMLAGDKTVLTIKRGDRPQQIQVTLGEAPRKRRRPAGSRVKTGFKLAVLLIEFADTKHDPRFKVSDFQRMIFSRGRYTGKSPTGSQLHGSVADYYHEVSDGVFKLNGKVFDWVASSSKKDDWRNRSGKEGKSLIREALRQVAAREGRNVFAEYQGVAVLYAGRVEHPRGRALWPHRSTVRLGGGRGSRALPFYITSELRGRSGGFSGITIHCHEFGHMLGLPDQYSMVRGKGMDLGVWCLMARSHRRKEGGHRPVHLCAWCKIKVGWLTPTTIDPRQPQKLALKPIENNGVQCIKIPLREAANEYLLLSYRQAVGFDKTLPRGGLLIWHVSGIKRVDLLEAHGRRNSRSRLMEIPFPLKNRRRIVLDQSLPDLVTSPLDRWRVEIGGIRLIPGKAVLFGVGPAPAKSE